jgi:iron(III) transport system ATP-binding protein
MSALRLTNVVKEYGSRPTLEYISLEIEHGELVVLLGPSGCGKTTLLRVIAGLEPISAGIIAIGGNEANRGPLMLMPPDERPIGMVFQDLALWPHLSAEANVTFPLAARGVGRSERRTRARELLALMDLEGAARRKPGELSGGERQRVALARALISEPQILLLDEPLASLDAYLRRRLRQKIRRIHEGFRMTTIYVTHDREEALGLADRIVLLRKGRIIEEGTPDLLYSRPKSAFAAQLLSDSNLLAASYLRNNFWETPVGVLKAPGPDDDQARHLLLVRPETLIRSKNGGSDFRGEVEAVSYKGGFWEAEVNIRGEEILWRSTAPVEPRETVHLELTEEPHPVVDDR